MASAVYIGAGTDTAPLVNLPHIRYFYYVDCSPGPEFLQGVDDGRHFANFDKYFVSRVVEKLANVGYVTDHVPDDVQSEPCVVYFTNKTTGNELHYYFNVRFPDPHILSGAMNLAILHSDTLLFIGYDVNGVILDMMPNLENIVLCSNSIYSFDETDSVKGLTKRLHDENKKYNYMYCERDGYGRYIRQFSTIKQVVEYAERDGCRYAYASDSSDSKTFGLFD